MSDSASFQESKPESYKLKFRVRPYELKDINHICHLMEITWPAKSQSKLKFQNRDVNYWALHCLQKNSDKFGLIIEQISESPQKNIKNKVNDYDFGLFRGFAMYSWISPINTNNLIQPTQTPLKKEYYWFDTDFDRSWNNKSNLSIKTKQNVSNLLIPNRNLNENYNMLNDHIIHITDVAIHPNYYNQGLATQLMQTLIYSFPVYTRFGLEVEISNTPALTCYYKRGFKIRREIENYYGPNRNCFKMSIISQYTSNDVKLFFLMLEKRHAEMGEKKEKENVNKNADDIKKDVADGFEFIKTEKSVKLISKAVMKFCSSKDLNQCLKLFGKEEIYDSDLINLTNEDLKHLFPKIGPRSRFRILVEELKNKQFYDFDYFKDKT